MFGFHSKEVAEQIAAQKSIELAKNCIAMPAPGQFDETGAQLWTVAVPLTVEGNFDEFRKVVEQRLTEQGVPEEYKKAQLEKLDQAYTAQRRKADAEAG